MIRDSDRQEVLASCGRDIEDVLIESLYMTGRHYVGIKDERLVCVFGVAEQGDVGVPYMLGTEEIYNNKKTFLYYSKKFIELISSEYKYLVNYVDARNVKAIEWLRWLGFTIHEKKPYGIMGFDFHKFDMRCDNV